MLHASNLSRNVAKCRGSFYVSCSSHRNNWSCKMGCYTWIFSCNLQHNKRCVAGSKKNCFECATWPLINFQMFLWTAKTMNVNLPNCSQGLRLTVANKTQTKKKFHLASGFCASLAILWALEDLRRPIKSKFQIFHKTKLSQSGQNLKHWLQYISDVIYWPKQKLSFTEMWKNDWLFLFVFSFSKMQRINKLLAANDL